MYKIVIFPKKKSSKPNGIASNIRNKNTKISVKNANFAIRGKMNITIIKMI